MSKAFRPYEPEQTFLMPASMKEWLPSDHLAYFIGGKHFVQAYNAQAAVDSAHQIIVAAETTNKPTDRGQAEPITASDVYRYRLLLQ